MTGPDQDEVWHEGGCLCGAVRYRVRGAPVWCAGCTCNSCVKSHGAPYVVWAGFDAADFEVTQGRLKEYRSSPHALRGFCPDCGSRLGYRKEAGGVAALEAAARVVYIAVATLDRPEDMPPDEIVHGAERISWMEFGGAIPVRDHISAQAGELQFGGTAPDVADALARRHFGPGKKE